MPYKLADQLTKATFDMPSASRLPLELLRLEYFHID